MNQHSLNEPDKLRIAQLQAQLDDLRLRFNISSPGTVLYRGEVSWCDDDVVIVEADGMGGAILKRVQGNYPVDYLTIEERTFSAEAAAENAAEAWEFGAANGFF